MNKLFIGKVLSGLTVIMLLLSCGGSKEKHTFEYKLKEGDTFSQHSAMNIKMSQSIMGQEINVTNAITCNMAFTVTKADADKYELEMKYTEMKIDIDMGTMKMSFDSNTPESVATPENLSPMFKAMVNKPVNVTMDKFGNVEKVTGFDKLLSGMAESIDSRLDEETKSQLLAISEQQFSEETINEMFKISFAYSNGKEVAVGESWELSREISNNNITLTSNTKMTFKNIKNDIATIEISGNVGTPQEGVTQNMHGFETKITMQGTQKGSMTVDMNTGLIKSTEIDQDTKGEIEIMGTKVPQSMQIKTTITGK